MREDPCRSQTINLHFQIRRANLFHVSPPALPSLNLLPAFEAAGRLGSFKEAASELHLTPSAVSQQMKALESDLAIALFVRAGRTIKLTQAGASYLREVQRVLADLGRAGKQLRSRKEKGVLRLNTLDFVAYEFLVPRLASFRERFPQVELRIETSVNLVDLLASDVDAVIRVGGGPWPGLNSIQLGTITATPVCSPVLARKLKTSEHLFDHPLLELRGQEHRGWHALAQSIGRNSARFNIITFDSYFETLRAAEAGLGVAFALFPLTSEWVLRRRLAVPFDRRTPLPGSIALLYPPATRFRKLFVEFGRWLNEQYAALPVLPEGRIVRK
jgi:LysR family glycine cleavage system transcriptional activator